MNQGSKQRVDLYYSLILSTPIRATNPYNVRLPYNLRFALQGYSHQVLEAGFTPLHNFENPCYEHCSRLQNCKAVAHSVLFMSRIHGNIPVVASVLYRTERQV